MQGKALVGGAKPTNWKLSECRIIDVTGGKAMQIDAVDEYNQEGHLIYSSNFIGAYVRGKTQEEALRKFPAEIEQYCQWIGLCVESSRCLVEIVQK
ncbi:MAG: hypothetical protein Q4B99_03860 [Clostridia bacterium]|nr:hypothetical protein [Clostridia bacterium]